MCEMVQRFLKQLRSEQPYTQHTHQCAQHAPDISALAISTIIKTYLPGGLLTDE